MGFFSSIIGWDKSMGATNAVLASHFIQQADKSTLKAIALEVESILQSVRPSQQRESLLSELNGKDRVVQMNFVALACDNLRISPPVRDNVWTRVKSPYIIGQQVDSASITNAIYLIAKQDGVKIEWPGNNTRFDFVRASKG
jgi:hypothetical protein